jgi:predicted glycosyl hydrolase (DUF1957 family)
MTFQYHMQCGQAVWEDVEKWQREEAARKAREHEKIMHFKNLQEQQVADKEERIRQVCIVHVLHTAELLVIVSHRGHTNCIRFAQAAHRKQDDQFTSPLPLEIN